MRYAVYLVVLLAGCATQEQIEARRQYEAEQQAAAIEAYRQQVFGQCRAYGFRDGTPEFSQCLMQVDQANQAQNAQMRAVILQQLLQQQYQQMPLCSSLPPGMAGWYQAQGKCR
ncbi:MAG: hypothetical protein HYX43_10530 [Burkholderiales bacterium]|nr:hypothetical protein [Burkholderiales bacterium]